MWHLPGADAIRAIDRLQVANSVVAALALVALGTEALRNWRGIHGNWRGIHASTAIRVAGVILLGLILTEQLNTTSATQLRHNAQVALLAAVPPVPSGCTSFFVNDSVPNNCQFLRLPGISHVDLSARGPTHHQRLQRGQPSRMESRTTWIAGLPGPSAAVDHCTWAHDGRLRVRPRSQEVAHPPPCPSHWSSART